MATSTHNTRIELTMADLANQDKPNYMGTAKKYGVARMTLRDRFLGQTLCDGDSDCSCYGFGIVQCGTINRGLAEQHIWLIPLLFLLLLFSLKSSFIEYNKIVLLNLQLAVILF